MAGDQLKLVLKSHTVCRNADGKIEWEADTVPVEVALDVATELCRDGHAFRVDTTMIRTGKEKF